MWCKVKCPVRPEFSFHIIATGLAAVALAVLLRLSQEIGKLISFIPEHASTNCQVNYRELRRNQRQAGLGEEKLGNLPTSRATRVKDPGHGKLKNAVN